MVDWRTDLNSLGIVANLIWTGIRCLIDKKRWKNGREVNK